MTTLKRLLLATTVLTAAGAWNTGWTANASPQDGARILLAQQQPAPDSEKKPDAAPDRRKPAPPPAQRQRPAPPSQPAPPAARQAPPPAPPAAQSPRAPQPPAAQSPQPPEQRQRPAQTPPPPRSPQPAQIQPPTPRQAPAPTAQDAEPQRRSPPGQIRREDIQRMQEQRRQRQQAPADQPTQSMPAPAPQGQPAPQRQPAQTQPAPAQQQPPATQTDRARPGVPSTADQDRRPRPDDRRPGQAVPPPPVTTQPGLAPRAPEQPQTTQPGIAPQGAPAPQTTTGPEPQRLDQLRGQRREERRDGRTIIQEGNRTIVREGDRTIIQRAEGDRFRRFSRDVRTERRGNETYSIAIRPDGIQVVTVTDADGRLLRRLRRDRSGREIVIIDNHYSGPSRAGSYFITLPPPRIRIPRERYIVEAYDASPALIYDTLIAPPVDVIERPYTLDEIRYSPDVRDRMPRIDLDTVTFDLGSWEVTPDQIDRLEPLATAMLRAIERNPQEVYLVEGHTDAVGPDIDNLSLSDRRAESVANILTEVFGVLPENMVTQGYGEQYLKIPTDGPERRNRRVTVRRITPLLAGGQPPQ